MFSRNVSGLMAATGISLLFVVPAHAEIDAKKVTDAIAAQFAGQGLPLTVTSAELSGSNVVAKGVSIKFPGDEPVNLGDVVLENVTEEGSGYLIGKISAPVTKVEQGTEKFEFNGASMSNVHVAGPDETDPV